MRIQAIFRTTRRASRLSFLMAAILALSLQSLSPSIASAAAPQDTYTWQKNIGTGCVTSMQPYGITTHDGKVYVTDTYNHSVDIFDSGGNLVNKFGSGGTGNGQFMEVDGIAVDTSGNIYIVDNNIGRVQKFNSAGVYQTQFIPKLSGTGSTLQVNGIAVDSSGTVYLGAIDNGTTSYYVQQYTAAGLYISQFGGPWGTGDGEFSGISGVAVDSSGNIYVADGGDANRVQKFDNVGEYQSQFATELDGSGDILKSYSIAVDNGGSAIYVTGYHYDWGSDTYSYYVQKYNSSGVLLDQIGGTPGSGDGQLDYPTGVTVDATGNVYAADNANNRIQKFDSTGAYQAQIKAEPSSLLCDPLGSALGPDGNLYVIDGNSNAIKVYNPTTGTLVRTIGAYGSGDGQFDYPRDLAFGAGGTIYVVDRSNNRIQILNPDGTYKAQFSDNGNLSNPTGIAIDKAGNVYVTDRDNARVVKFSSSGTYLSEFGTPDSTCDGTAPGGEFCSLGDIALDSAGNIYVDDADNNRIQKFNPSGVYISQLGGDWGNCDGNDVGANFCYLDAIAIDSHDNIYVSDEDGYIKKFDSDYTYLGRFGGKGSDLTQLGGWKPGLTVDDEGNVYVADSDNDRISIWNAPIIPSAPQNVKAATISPTSLKVTWAAPAHVGSAPVSYRVMYRMVGVSAWAVAGETDGNTFSYTLAGLTPGAQYEVQVAAFNSLGVSTDIASQASDGIATAKLLVPGAPNAGFDSFSVLRSFAGMALIAIVAALVAISRRILYHTTKR